MDSVNTCCVQNVGSSNVKCGGTRRYWYSNHCHWTVLLQTVKVRPHWAQQIHCDRLRVCRVKQPCPEGSVCLSKYNDIISNISPVSNGIRQYRLWSCEVACVSCHPVRCPRCPLVTRSPWLKSPDVGRSKCLSHLSGFKNFLPWSEVQKHTKPTASCRNWTASFMAVRSHWTVLETTLCFSYVKIKFLAAHCQGI